MTTLTSNSSHLTEYRFYFGTEKKSCEFCNCQFPIDDIVSIDGYEICEDCFNKYEKEEND